MMRLLAMLVMMAMLSACAVGGALPVPGDVVMQKPSTDEYIEAADGFVLALTRWPANEERAIILAAHGFGDYGPSTFDGPARYWAGLGLTTYAYDQRGFGRNPSRGRWPGVDALVDDLVAVTSQIRRRHPCLPLFVVGHSMGGGVTLAAAGQGLEADGIVLAAPAIWGGMRLNPFYRIAAWTTAAVVPERRFSGRGIVRIQASDNIDVLRALGRDPLYLSPPSARELMGLIRVTDRAAENAANVTLPTLLLLGEKDQITPNDLVEEVVDETPGPHRTVRYAEGWHLLFRDLQAERVWHDVAGWVEARSHETSRSCAPSGQAAETG